jgi:hypothetical protein
MQRAEWDEAVAAMRQASSPETKASESPVPREESSAAMPAA